MEKSTLDYLISSVIPYVQRVDVVGDGEPLIVKDLLFYLLESTNIFKVPVTICTNAVLLDEDTARQLVELNLSDINISLDAARKETYEKIRGADFEKVIQNIETLDRIKQKAGRSIPHVHLSMVAMRDNIEELPELIELAKIIGAESVTVQAMGEEAEEMKGKSAFLHHRDLAEEVLYRCLIETEATGFPLKLWPDQLEAVLSSDDDLGKFLSGQLPPPGDSEEWRKNCSFLWSSPFITTDGTVRPCCSCLPPMGNITQQNFNSIWYSKAYAALRKNMLSGHLPDACFNCPGMGWRRVLVPKSSLQASDDLFQYFPGWYEKELEEREYRWSRDKAVLFLRRSPGKTFLLLQMRRSSMPNAPQRGNIIVDGETTIPFHLLTTDWETIEIPLPKSGGRDDDMLMIEIHPTHSLRPADVLEDSLDARDLGIKLSRAWLEEWPKKVVFGQQLVLLGYEITPETWSVEGDALIRTYWRSLDKTSENLKVFFHFTRETEKGPAGGPIRRKMGFGRKDFFQSDQLLIHNGHPSSNWEAGTFIAIEHRLPIPEDIRSGHYRLELGLYPEGAPKNRLTIVRSDRPHEQNRTLLGTVLVS